MTFLTWPQARALARAGQPIRRAGSSYWLTFDGALWIYHYIPARVAQAADFGAADFAATDWTTEQVDGSPAFPTVGQVTGEQPYSDAPPTGDPVVSVTLRTSLAPTGAGCLTTIPATCTVYADVSIIGGPTATGSLDVTVEGVTQTVSASAGYTHTHTFTGVAISGAGDVLNGSIEYTDSAAATWNDSATYTVPAKCPPAGWTRSHSNSVAGALDGFITGLGLGTIPDWNPAEYTAQLRVQWSSPDAATRLRLDSSQMGALGTPIYDTSTNVTTLDHTFTVPTGTDYVRAYANFTGATAYSITLTLSFTPV